MKTKQEQIEEMAVIGCVRNPQAHTAEECAKCDFKQGQCNAYRHAEALYNAGYRKVPDGAVVLTPDYLIAKIGNLGELKEKIGSLTSEKEGWKRRYIDSGQRNKRLSIKNAQLKAENEELKAKLNARLTCNFVKTAQTHAVQDFAEKLKTRLEAKEQHYICMYDWNGHSAVTDCENEVDELLKELVK